MYTEELPVNVLIEESRVAEARYFELARQARVIEQMAYGDDGDDDIDDDEVLWDLHQALHREAERVWGRFEAMASAIASVPQEEYDAAPKVPWQRRSW